MNGEPEFLALFLKHQGEIRAFVRAVIRDPAERDDVLQEVALVLWRELDRYDRQRPFGAWARGVTAKTILKRFDRARRQPIALSPEAIAALAEVQGGQPAASSAREDALRECLERLPERSRRLVTLRYGEGLTLAELAARVSSTLDAVHKALSRVREGLERCVERRLGDVGGVS
jgi:RNA polymerase sigma-70 factor (ECF subfamily)